MPVLKTKLSMRVLRQGLKDFPITSNIILNTKHSCEYVRVDKPGTSDIIMYFPDCSSEEPTKLYEKFKELHESGLITEFDTVELVFGEMIALRRYTDKDAVPCEGDSPEEPTEPGQAAE